MGWEGVTLPRTSTKMLGKTFGRASRVSFNFMTEEEQLGRNEQLRVRRFLQSARRFEQP